MNPYIPRPTRSALLLLAAILLTAWPPAFGQDALSNTTAATDQELSKARGGFVTDEGLLVSFGIDRAIYVNGVLNTASNFSITRADDGSLYQSVSAHPGINDVKVIQLGPGNSVSLDKMTGSLLTGPFTVIQSSLDNQFIKNTTTVSASVTNLNLFRDMNLTSLISQQMIHAVH